MKILHLADLTFGKNITRTITNRRSRIYVKKNYKYNKRRKSKDCINIWRYI